MKYLKIFVVATLLISLVINFRLLTRMNNVENQLNSISNNQMQVMNSMNSQASTINNIMNDFKREQSWISPFQMDVEAESLEKGKVNLHFEWQVKELLKNSEVVFHYKFRGDKEYNEISPSEIENGLFEANIPVQFQLEPEWHITVTNANREREVAKRIMEEKYIEEKNKSQLEYYVTVSNDDLIKSSEINTTHIGNIGTKYYGILDTFVHIYDENYRLSVRAHNPNYGSGILLEEAYLMKYKNGTLIEEEKLTSIDIKNTESMREPLAEFHNNSTNENFEYTRLVLKVIYSNGDSFEEEIYSE